MDQKCDIKYNRMHYLIGLKWKQRKKQLPFAELGIEHTLPWVWRSILSLQSSWEFNVANEGQSSRISIHCSFAFEYKIDHNMLIKTHFETV